MDESSTHVNDTDYPVLVYNTNADSVNIQMIPGQYPKMLFEAKTPR